MIKKNSKLILGIIIGLVISLGGVYAANEITANSVKLDKSNGKLADISGDKVQDALDYFYAKAANVGTCPEGKMCLDSNFFNTRPGYSPNDDRTTYTQSAFVQNLKVGDLVKIIPPVTSVRLDGVKSGYSTYNSTSTYLNPNELMYWRVIRKNTNGTVDVVSEYASSVNVYFSGTIGYQYFIEYLIELTSYYENPAYTIGSRYMGYYGQYKILYRTGAFDGSKNTRPWTASTSSSTNDGGLGAGDIYYSYDYDLVKAAYTGTTTYGTNSSGTAKVYQVGTTTATNYWLASRYYAYYSSTSFDFSGRAVDTSGDVAYAILCNYASGWSYYSQGFALRPILTLKADVNAISGDGKSEATAYVLG